MRLTEQQVLTIKHKTRLLFGDEAKVYLFGSRTNDQAKGGDIDLFIELTSPAQQLALKTLQLNGELQQAFGMQKIDIVFHAPNYARQPIHNFAKTQGVLL